MTLTQILTRAAVAFRRRREDRATLAMLERLDPRARRELETFVRLRRDEAEFSEFDSKGRSVRRSAAGHIAPNASRAHS
jgi:hypothetical protein